MKYKRQLATSLFALALLTGSPTVFAEEPTGASKVVEYKNQIHMKSSKKYKKPVNFERKLQTNDED